MSTFKDELIAGLQNTGDSYEDALVVLNSLVLCKHLCKCTQSLPAKTERSKTTDPNNYDAEILETMTKLAIQITQVNATKERELQSL